VDIIRTLSYPGRLRWWKYFCCFICVTLLWALHIVIKHQFFTFIYIYIYIYSIRVGVDPPRVSGIRQSIGNSTLSELHAPATIERPLGQCQAHDYVCVHGQRADWPSLTDSRTMGGRLACKTVCSQWTEVDWLRRLLPYDIDQPALHAALNLANNL